MISRRIAAILEENEDDGVLELEDLEPLMPCIAYFNDKWYRARVISVRGVGEIFVSIAWFFIGIFQGGEVDRKMPKAMKISYSSQKLLEC